MADDSDAVPKPVLLDPPARVHLGVVDGSVLEPLPGGCPRCDEYPDFPRRHCGLPGCRDEQAVAYARAVGRDPHEVLAAMDEQEAPTGGLCGACRLASTCVLGAVVMETQPSLEAVVAECAGYKPT